MTQTLAAGTYPRTLFTGIALAVAAGLSACGGGGTTAAPSTGGGGGTTVAASPYIAFASTYLAYPTTGAPNYASTQADGAYLTSIQHGDVITGFGGNYIYGGFSSDQHDMNFMRGYRLQITTTNGVAPTTAGDYVYAAFLAPGTNGTSVGSVDISQSSTLVIEMGNTYRQPAVPPPFGGTARTFTIDLNDAHGSTAATNDCAVDQALNDGSATGNSQDGFFTYAIPLSSFTCTKGSVTALTALTTVAVKIVGNKNMSVAAGDYNILSVGSIGFTAATPTGTNTPVAAALAL